MTAVPHDKTLRFASVEDFLAYDFPDDLRRELIDGVAVAQASPSDEHGRIIINIGRAIGDALDAAGSRCFSETGSGLRPPRRRRPTHRIPDLLVRCPGDGTNGVSTNVVIVFEVLSPSNSVGEMTEKGRDYKSIPTIRQIVHVQQDRYSCSYQRKAGELWIADEVEGVDAVLPLEVGVTIPLAAIYRNVAIVEEGGAVTG